MLSKMKVLISHSVKILEWVPFRQEFVDTNINNFTQRKIGKQTINSQAWTVQDSEISLTNETKSWTESSITVKDDKKALNT